MLRSRLRIEHDQLAVVIQLEELRGDPRAHARSDTEIHINFNLQETNSLVRFDLYQLKPEPPLTQMFCPVTKSDKGLKRYNSVPTRSSGCWVR